MYSVHAGYVCTGDPPRSSARSAFLWANATLLAGAGHLWLTQTENIYPHRKRPGTDIWMAIVHVL